MPDKIHYSRLAGPKYAGLDGRYKVDQSNKYNNVYTYAAPAVHVDFPNTTKAEGPPNLSRFRPNRQTVEPDGTIVASSTVSTVYREAFHSFKYYESLGSVYGYHNIIMDRQEVDKILYTRERWQGEPVNIERIDSLNISNPSQLDSTISNCALTFHASLNPNAPDNLGLDIEFDNITTDKDGKRYIDIFIGEFHLLPNTPRSVYRTNISWDIHPVFGTKLSKNPNGESYCLVDGMTLEELLQKNHFTGSGFPNTPLSKKPISVTEANFIEYYVGVARVPGISSRPKEMQSKVTSMRHPDYLEAGAQIRWRSLKDRCSTWLRVYDGTDIKDLLSLDAYRPGHYVLNTKIRISLDKLKIYLEHLVDGYNSPLEWKIIMWLPWFSMLAHDAVEYIEHPKLATFIEQFDQVEFQMPNNYKSGGSYHFTINIYDTDKETLIYTESSNKEIEHWYSPTKFFSRIRRGRWYYQMPGGEFQEIQGKNIRFNADYEDGHGVNHEVYGKIKYIPSNELSAYVATTTNLHMQIITHDGTMKHEPGLVIKYT